MEESGPASVDPSSTAATATTPSPSLILQPFGSDLWTVEGPVVNFYGFPYPTRMVVVKLSNGDCWIWSPISYSKELAESIDRIAGGRGKVKHLVAPNYIHWLFLKEWIEQYPSARVYAAPGLRERKIARDIRFDAVLGDEADASYASDIQQVVFRGSALDEVVFFHRKSKTAIFCDLIQRFPPAPGWKGWLMKLDGLVGEKGSTPKEWQLSFWWKGRLDLTRAALDKVLYEWQPDRLVIAHGACAPENATEIIRNCLTWIPENARRREWCACCSSSSAQEKED